MDGFGRIEKNSGKLGLPPRKGWRRRESNPGPEAPGTDPCTCVATEFGPWPPSVSFHACHGLTGPVGGLDYGSRHAGPKGHPRVRVVPHGSSRVRVRSVGWRPRETSRPQPGNRSSRGSGLLVFCVAASSTARRTGYAPPVETARPQKKEGFRRMLAAETLLLLGGKPVQARGGGKGKRSSIQAPTSRRRERKAGERR